MGLLRRLMKDVQAYESHRDEHVGRDARAGRGEIIVEEERPDDGMFLTIFFCNILSLPPPLITRTGDVGHRA